ncbi:hypothetical protein M918_10770 [Clostridium sp. BL8]|nr:hypothetical protein M918_10770 [Clostridium sp. BL8]
MTNLQAALGVAQLEQLEKFINKKKENYELYKLLISDIPGLEILEFRRGIRPNYWFYSLRINKEIFPMDKDELLQFMNINGIQTRPIWGLINEQKPYEHNQTYKIEKSRKFSEEILNIPCSSNLIKEDIFKVVSVLSSITKENR